MEFIIRALPKLIAAIHSLLYATSLRDRMFTQAHEHELMWTALDDIARMYKDTPAGGFAKDTLNRVSTRYGR